MKSDYLSAEWAKRDAAARIDWLKQLQNKCLVLSAESLGIEPDELDPLALEAGLEFVYVTAIDVAGMREYNFGVVGPAFAGTLRKRTPRLGPEALGVTPACIGPLQANRPPSTHVPTPALTPPVTILVSTFERFEDSVDIAVVAFKSAPANIEVGLTAVQVLQLLKLLEPELHATYAGVTLQFLVAGVPVWEQRWSRQLELQSAGKPELLELSL